MSSGKPTAPAPAAAPIIAAALPPKPAASITEAKALAAKQKGRIAIVGGAGSSGRDLAIRYANAGYIVDIIDPEAKKLPRTITAKCGADTPLTATFAEDQLLTPAEVGPRDYIAIISVTKSFSVNKALADAIVKANKNPAACPVLTLHNGLVPSIIPNGIDVPALQDQKEFEEILKQAGITIINGVLNYPAAKNAEGVQSNLPNDVILKKKGITIANKTDISKLEGVELTAAAKRNAAIDRIEGVFKSVGMEVQHKSTTAQVIWNKIADMLAIGLLALLNNKTFEDASKQGSLTGEICGKALDEYIAIANKLKKSGAEFSVDIIKENIIKIMGEKGKHPGSMRPDVVAGRPLEKDIFAAIAQVGKALGIDSPCIKQTYDLLNAIPAPAVALETKEKESKANDKGGASSREIFLNNFQQKFDSLERELLTRRKNAETCLKEFCGIDVKTLSIVQGKALAA